MAPGLTTGFLGRRRCTDFGSPLTLSWRAPHSPGGTGRETDMQDQSPMRSVSSDPDGGTIRSGFLPVCSSF